MRRKALERRGSAAKWTVVAMLAAASVVVPAVSSAATPRASSGPHPLHHGYYQCSGNPRDPGYLLEVGELTHVSARAACDVWVSAGGGLRFVRCHGRPFHAGSYSYVVRHSWHGWRITEARQKPLVFARGRMSFLAGGQDEPPYPC